MRPVASSVSLQSAAAKAAALPEARRRRPEQQEGSGSHPAEADRRGSSGAEGPTIITDFVDRRGGSSRQTGFTGHTTHENASDRRPQENRCPSHKQIFSTNPPRALGAGRGGELYPPCRSLISEQNQPKPFTLWLCASLCVYIPVCPSNDKQETRPALSSFLLVLTLLHHSVVAWSLSSCSRRR
mgnify:CR=1 FL=1